MFGQVTYFAKALQVDRRLITPFRRNHAPKLCVVVVFRVILSSNNVVDPLLLCFSSSLLTYIPLHPVSLS